MLQEFIEQDYLIIESNVVVNNVSWNGDTNTWTPPVGSIAIVKATTPAMIWEPIIVDNKITDWVLTQVMGAGQIGFTWDGSVVTTNEPKPEIPVQPVVNGTVSA